ncbi:uncharacterized protein J4E87_007882 [Alternaria ethzedia]|uniref:uncharacterized protein n=1 Tax=Alternaria ethzedia TaxID=181014 RepID=UPI0020C41E8A|nr:uncharacterized protein J4E87_007882 [Alternaria ethzedia]KAI4618214.1 hypothetical protein J4E87_007882 [Alternaria ethzedia]
MASLNYTPSLPTTAASAEKMVKFALFPIETLTSCIYILAKVYTIISNSTSSIGISSISDVSEMLAHYIKAKELVDSKDTVWPLIVKEQSHIYNNITGIIKTAIECLVGSFFGSFVEECERLTIYLKPQRSFFASGLATHRDGTVLKRDLIVLEQRRVMDAYKNDPNRPECFWLPDHHKQEDFEDFLMTLAWAREKPLRRMFTEEFKGVYLEHEPEVQDEPASDYVSLTDTESVVDTLTPSTTRTTSPAPTERL